MMVKLEFYDGKTIIVTFEKPVTTHIINFDKCNLIN